MSSRDIGYLIKNIDEKLRARADADLKCHNVTLSQSFVLTFLYSREGGQATQKEIEDHLEVSHPAVTGIISRMEQSHHVTTWIDPQNKRNKMVRLTPQAKELEEEMKLMRGQMEKIMLQGFSSEDAQNLKRMLLMVNENLTKIQSR